MRLLLVSWALASLALQVFSQETATASIIGETNEVPTGITTRIQPIEEPVQEGEKKLEKRSHGGGWPGYSYGWPWPSWGHGGGWHHSGWHGHGGWSGHGGHGGHGGWHGGWYGWPWWYYGGYGSGWHGKW